MKSSRVQKLSSICCTFYQHNYHAKLNMSLYRDPWAKREAWRKSPIFSNRAMFSNLFPGFGIAVVAFSAYVAYDNLFNPANVHALKEHAKEDHDTQSVISLLKDGKH